MNEVARAMSGETGRISVTGGTPDFHHSRDGTGCGSAHNPFRLSRTSSSNPSSTVLLDYGAVCVNIIV